MPLDNKGKPILYKPWISKAKNKKYSVYVKVGEKVKVIHFGDSRYEDFSQHKNKDRQKSYLARAKGIKNKQGELTWKDKNTANYWAVKLWGDTTPSWATG
tara:strand:+ start:152 stop:451 length:300 start_codon:yes stop_codon:yes gene_type:complete